MVKESAAARCKPGERSKVLQDLREWQQKFSVTVPQQLQMWAKVRPVAESVAGVGELPGAKEAPTKSSVKETNVFCVPQRELYRQDVLVLQQCKVRQMKRDDLSHMEEPCWRCHRVGECVPTCPVLKRLEVREASQVPGESTASGFKVQSGIFGENSSPAVPHRRPCYRNGETILKGVVEREQQAGGLKDCDSLFTGKVRRDIVQGTDFSLVRDSLNNNEVLHVGQLYQLGNIYPMQNVMFNFAEKCSEVNSESVTVGNELTPIEKSVGVTPKCNVPLEPVKEVVHSGKHAEAESECVQHNMSENCVGNSDGGYLKGEVNLKPCPMYNVQEWVCKFEAVCKTECTYCFGPGHITDNYPFKKCDDARVKLKEAFDLYFKSKDLREKSDSGGDSQTTYSEPLETEGCVKLGECMLSGNQTECVVEKDNMVTNGGKPHGVNVEESKIDVKLPLKAPDCEILDTPDPVCDPTPVLQAVEGVLQTESVCLSVDESSMNTHNAAKCELLATTEHITDCVSVCVTQICDQERHPTVGKCKRQSVHDCDAKACVSDWVDTSPAKVSSPVNKKQELCVTTPIAIHVLNPCDRGNKVALKGSSKSVIPSIGGGILRKTKPLCAGSGLVAESVTACGESDSHGSGMIIWGSKLKNKGKRMVMPERGSSMQSSLCVYTVIETYGFNMLQAKKCPSIHPGCQGDEMQIPSPLSTERVGSIEVEIPLREKEFLLGFQCAHPYGLKQRGGICGRVTRKRRKKVTLAFNFAPGTPMFEFSDHSKECLNHSHKNRRFQQGQKIFAVEEEGVPKKKFLDLGLGQQIPVASQFL
ncbi:uncharacterized protein LOC121397293 [Xenopus laevis]|uniref:Uncharacterized protein LOC121397293 n=1 Tax=Xenopus laevis TaxID=8355 RepID=A0A8J1LJZ6_XENLA|nr:uncharacterized protein LOC121397293 [Xenopus laevis]